MITNSSTEISNRRLNAFIQSNNKNNSNEFSLQIVKENFRKARIELGKKTAQEIAIGSLLLLVGSAATYYIISSVNNMIDLNLPGYQATAAKVAFWFGVAFLTSHLQEMDNKKPANT